jgi:hypothetical protein
VAGPDATPHPLLVPRSIKQCTALLSLRAFMACKKGETYLPVIIIIIIIIITIIMALWAHCYCLFM